MTTIASADELLRRLPRGRPDLIVMDLMMPGTHGLDALRRLRADGDDIPLILLTAKSDDVDRIVGLEHGADDYLGKPFNPRELVARIHAVLRRRGGSSGGAPVADAHRAAVGEFELDLRTRTLNRGSESQSLTTAEFALLRVLVTHPFKPLTRERLLELTQGVFTESSERSVDVQILRLRRLVEADAQNRLLIHTVRGTGYVFVPRRPE